MASRPRPRSRPRGPRRGAPALSARSRARIAGLLVVAVLVGVGVALALRGSSDGPQVTPAPLPPGSAAGQRDDPLRYRAGRQAAFVARATQGLAHVLYAKSPGGAVASADRVAALRPLVVKAAGDGKVVDANTLEAIVLLESAGYPNATASNDLNGAVGLTQILAQTGQGLLRMQVDVAASTKLTREIARGGPKLAAREGLRRRVDERFDPAKSLAATVRYLQFARGQLGGHLDLAVASYHMGVGNLQSVIQRFAGGSAPPYAELYFASTPLSHPSASKLLSSFGDDSSTYLWRIDAAKAIMRLSRTDPTGLRQLERLQTDKNSAEEVLHPEADSDVFHTAEDLTRALRKATIRPLDAAQLRSWGIRIDPAMGELAGRLDEPKAHFRALREEALVTLRYLGRSVRAISGSSAPLTLTSSVRDDAYQHLLTLQNIEATHAFSEHTTGYTFDILRKYASPAQAQAFQFLLDRLTALNLIAWVREPAAIHVTVAGDAARVLTSGP